jgi:hypothetical protein
LTSNYICSGSRALKERNIQHGEKQWQLIVYGGNDGSCAKDYQSIGNSSSHAGGDEIRTSPEGHGWQTKRVFVYWREVIVRHSVRSLSFYMIQTNWTGGEYSEEDLDSLFKHIKEKRPRLAWFIEQLEPLEELQLREVRYKRLGSILI